MSFLSRISLANKSLVALATIAILICGGIIIPSLKEELFPSISFPAVTVITAYPGASPAIVEQNITDPLEQVIQGVPGLQQTSSSSNEGSSIITVSYNYGTDINQATQTLTSRISKIQQSLPTGVTPQVQSFSIDDLPVISLSATSDEDQQTLANDLNQTVVPALQRIDGVGTVNVTGVRTQIVTINLDLSKLTADGISATQVQTALQANNISVPSGAVTANGKTVPIITGNSFTSLNDLKNVVIGAKSTGASSLSGTGAAGAGLSGGGAAGFAGAATGASATTTATVPTLVTLGDVATVKEDLAPSTSLTRTNGKPSLGLSIVKTSSGNTVSISNAVRQQIPQLQNQLGHNTTLSVISDQAPTISQSVSDLVREGVIGAVFAIVVILIFLLSIRSTLVTAISIPLSIIIALIGLYIGNYTLNLLTLGGLTIAVGRVVDDSIVVLENIYSHLQRGEKKSQAIPTAVREVAGAITASTLTTVAVFLPIAFVGGLVGELFSSFSIAVTIALLASLFVALTIIPVLAYWFLKTPTPKSTAETRPAKQEKNSFLERGYTVLISWVTGRGWHRALLLIAAVVILLISLGLSRFLQTNLFGNSGTNTYSVSVTLPPATSLQTTDNATRQVELAIAALPEVQTYQSVVGGGGSILSSSGGTNTASISITTKTNSDPTTFEQTLRSKVNSLHNVGTVTISGGQSGLGSSNLEVDIKASNTQALDTAAQQVKNAVSQVSGLADITSNVTDGSPQIQVNVDSQRALAHGMTAAQVAQDIREIYSGTDVSKITLNNTQQDVYLYIGNQNANTVQAINAMLIPTTTGTVKVSDLATVQQVLGPTLITHINGNRTASVTATVTASNVGGVSTTVQQKLDKLTLPTGVTATLGGVTSQQSDTFKNLGIAVLIAIMLVYCIMVATFRSLLQPLILLISIPFAATGSIILLLLTRIPMGAAALIGFLMLVGIVVTNAIVLLDLVRQYREKGLDARTAVIEGGRHRLRPILMTAAATILALAPMALGASSSSGFISQPLAVVVIGGLITSTLLTLLLVPTLYVIVEGIRGRSGGQPPVSTIADVDTTEPQTVPAL